MQTHEIPRDYKGESRILFIFSMKGLLYTAIGIAIGFLFYLIFDIIGLGVVGIAIMIGFGVLGFSIATFKMPDSKKFKITEKTGRRKYR